MRGPDGRPWQFGKTSDVACGPCGGTGRIWRCAEPNPNLRQTLCATCRGRGRYPTITQHSFANGRFTFASFHTRHLVEAARETFNEDWKTASAHNQASVPAGTRGIITDILWNFYGVWATVEFEGRDHRIYADFAALNYIETLMT